MAWIVTALVILPSWVLVLCLALSVLEPRLLPPGFARAQPWLFLLASLLTLAGLVVWLWAPITRREHPDPAEPSAGRVPSWPLAVVSLLAALVVLVALQT